MQHSVRLERFLASRRSEFERFVFAVTSANHARSRYNPLPFHVRAIGVDRLARALDVRHRIVGIPHYRPTDRFAAHTIKEIADQAQLDLAAADTTVLCGTPEVVKLYEALGFEVIAVDGEGGEEPNETSRSLTADFPEVFAHAQRLERDPLLDDAGSITQTRDYGVYVTAMSNRAVIEMKLDDIREHVVEGRIADEGCADGALLVELSRLFPDSDLIGIEITGELLAQCRERQRRGHFGESYVHFHQRNLFSDVFEPASIDTTICNSTLHELWSYGEGASTIRTYLARKFQQTAPGGRIVIRDVVGPTDGDREVLLWCDDADGETEGDVATLSTAARFERFAREFVRPFSYDVVERDGRRFYRVTLRQAVEMMTKKDYVANWASEMHEEFAFWSLEDWKAALREAGFLVRDESHAYTNPWIVENRWQGRVELCDLEGQPLPEPPTTMVLVGERPGVRSS